MGNSKDNMFYLIKPLDGNWEQDNDLINTELSFSTTDLEHNVKEREEIINKIIDVIESGAGSASVSEIKVLAEDSLTSEIREARFFAKLCRLIEEATKGELFEGDKTQGKVEHLLYLAVGELAWDTAESIGYSKAERIVNDALEPVEDQLRDL